MLAKISKIARFIFLILLFTVGLLYILLRSSPVQTWLAGMATDYLSKELGTTVSISGVDIEFFKTGIFEDVYIEDKQGDTLIYVHRLKVDYHTFDKQKHLIDLNSIALEDGKILFGEHLGDTAGNYEFLIDYFKGGPRDPSKPKVVWTIHAKDIKLSHSRFDWHVEGKKPFDYMAFDYNRLSFSDINGDLEDFYLVDDSMHFQSEKLSMTERCGLKLKNLTADTRIHEGGIELAAMQLETANGTVLQDFFSLETKDWKDYSNFVEIVPMKASLKRSIVSLKDIAYFSNYLSEYNETIRLSGDMYGTVSRLKGKNLQAGLFNRSVLEGDWSINGLPDTDNAFIDFNIKTLETDHADITALTHNHDLPDNIRSLGLIQYKGRFTGFYNDFVAYGDLHTALGRVNSDINLKFREGFAHATYSGHLVTDNFQLNRFYTGVPVNSLSFDMNVKGQGMKTDNYNMEIDGTITAAAIAGYTYHNIKTEGKFSPKLFSGKAIVRDPNLDLDFVGTLDLAGKIPVADFVANVKRADLRALQLDTASHDLSGMFTINFTGNNIDDAEGYIAVDSLRIYRNNKPLELAHAVLSSSKSSSNELLSLKSDLVDARVEGNYTLSKLPVSIEDLMATLIPSYFSPPKEMLPDENINFDINLKQPEVITALYMPELSIKPGTVKGYYKSLNRSLKLDIVNPEITWQNYTVKMLKLGAVKTSDSLLKISFRASDLVASGYNLQDVAVSSLINQNHIDFNLQLKDTGQDLDLSTEGRFVVNKDSFILGLSNADIGVEGTRWHLLHPGSIQMTDAQYLFRNLLLKNGSQTLNIDGAYTQQNSHDKLNIDVTDFDLSIINKFTGNKDGKSPKIFGRANGMVYLSTLENRLFIGSDLKVSNLAVGTDTIGDLTVTSESRDNAIQYVTAKVINGTFNGLSIDGTINFKNKYDNLDLNLHVPESDLKVVEQFVVGIASNVKGRISADMTLKGSFDDPLLRGDVNLKNVSMLVDYLKTTVNFSTTVGVEPNAFIIHPFDIFDDQNNSGSARGSITHRDYSKFRLDFTLSSLKNFHALNTRFYDNNLYYGQAYVNGNASIKGPFDALDIYINAKTLKNTHIYIPISDGDESGFPEYVHFKTGKKRLERNEGIENINSLEMDIEATADATIEMIFDEALGDKIVGSGKGNLKFEIDKAGDFYMFGSYTVAKGEYLFTLLNIYNKRFFVKPGGTITWYGDPFGARLDLVAVNTTKTSSAPLLTGIQTQNSGASPGLVDVQSELYLKGNLFSPEITFGLQFPNVENVSGSYTNELNSVIRRIKTDKEETNRQVFSLLIFGNLLTPTFTQSTGGYAGGGSSVANTGASDLVSNQLSNWLNKIDPNWKVNVNYKGSGSPSLNPNFVLSISRKFLNDRLTFDGSYNNNSTGAPNINLEYKLTQEGNIRVKAYNRSGTNAVNATSINAPVNTMGVGIVYQKEFNKFTLKRRKKQKN